MCLTATTAGGLLLSSWWVLKAARQRKLGVDLVAVLALAGTLLMDETLAGALITVMLVTGRSLERCPFVIDEVSSWGADVVWASGAHVPYEVAVAGTSFKSRGQHDPASCEGDMNRVKTLVRSPTR